MIQLDLIEPARCKTIDEVREQIDKLDYDIIAALGMRLKYVHQVARFKENNEKSIKAEDRYQAVLKQRGVWAEENGLSEGVIKKMYEDLIHYFIEVQKNILTKEQS